MVAGASEGLGAAFAEALARAGFDLVLVARRVEVLEARADELRNRCGVEVRTLALDLAEADAITRLVTATATLEVGLAIYNAAYAPLGPLLERTTAELDRVVAVNVRGPLQFARAFAAPMSVRRRGAVVLVSSLAGQQGTPRLASYAASKAFSIVLAEGLWAELRGLGVDVLAVCAGAIRTPGYQARAGVREAPGTLDAADVAAATLRALGRGPRVIPGWLNRVASWILGRMLPRRVAIAIMASSTEGLS